MSHISKSFLLGISLFLIFFVTGLAQAQAVDSESHVCTYQLLCERQAVIFERIDSAMTRAVQISDQELATELILSLESAHVLAQDGYLGKSLMTLSAVDRVVRRQLMIVESVSPVEPIITTTTTSTPTSIAVDTGTVATTTIDALPIIDDLTHIDKDESILSE